MTCTLASTDDIALVGLRGELDVATRQRTAAEVRALLDAGCRELLFDLTDLTYLDCAGLGALLDAAQAAEAVGARCYAFRAHGQPRALMAWARSRGVSSL